MTNIEVYKRLKVDESYRLHMMYSVEKELMLLKREVVVDAKRLKSLESMYKFYRRVVEDDTFREVGLTLLIKKGVGRGVDDGCVDKLKNRLKHR